MTATTAPLFVVTPQQLIANFVYSNVPEDDAPVYDPALSYPLGFRVILTEPGTHKIYESLTSANVGNYPPTSSAKWLEIGPTNRWTMFDESVGTFTTNPGTIEFQFVANRITSMGFLGIQARSINIKIYEGAAPEPFFDKTITLKDKAVITDWYEYYTAEFMQQTELIIRNLPSVNGCVFTITIDSGSSVGLAKLGSFIYGTYSEIGQTQYGATAGIIDYSVKTTDSFGKTTITRRNFSKRMDLKVYVNNSQLDSVVSKLSSIRSLPCLWVGSQDSFETLSIYGFYRDYSVDISYPTYSVLSIQIEGLAG